VPKPQLRKLRERAAHPLALDFAYPVEKRFRRPSEVKDARKTRDLSILACRRKSRKLREKTARLCRRRKKRQGGAKSNKSRSGETPRRRNFLSARFPSTRVGHRTMPGLASSRHGLRVLIFQGLRFLLGANPAPIKTHRQTAANLKKRCERRIALRVRTPRAWRCELRGKLRRKNRIGLDAQPALRCVASDLAVVRSNTLFCERGWRNDQSRKRQAGARLGEFNRVCGASDEIGMRTNSEGEHFGKSFSSRTRWNEDDGDRKVSQVVMGRVST